MIYKATVIDNRDYFTKGTIRVRAPYFYHKDMESDLSKDTAVITEGNYIDSSGKDRHRDLDAILWTPFGGGRNYGALVIPQINQDGLIFFPENDEYENPIWFGGFFEPNVDDVSGIAEFVNFPSDKADEDEIDGSVNEISNMDEEISDLLKKNIVIRTKNTEYDESDGAKLDWKQQKTTNLISVDNKSVRIRHYNSVTGWDEKSANNYSDVVINDDGVAIQYIDKTGEVSNLIDINADGIEISTQERENVISINNENNVVIKTPNKILFEESSEIQFMGDGDVLVKYKDLYDILTVFADHIHISPNGPTDGPLTGSMAPVLSQIKTLLMNMQAAKLKTE